MHLQEFTTTGSSNTDTGKASGSLETKYKVKDYGLTFSQKWNTDNTLGTEVTMEDKVKRQHLRGEDQGIPGCFLNKSDTGPRTEGKAPEWGH